MAKLPQPEIDRRIYLERQAALRGVSSLLDKISTTPGYSLIRGATYWEGQPVAIGDFTGPASSVLHHFVSFADTSGKVGEDSGYSAASFDVAGAAAAALITAEAYADSGDTVTLASAHTYSDAGDAAALAALANTKLQSLIFIFDGGTTALVGGEEDFFYCQYACTMTGYVIFGDQVGTAEFDIQVDTYANFPPTGADSKVAAAPPTITASQFIKSTTLTGWTAAIAANSWVRVTITSTATFKKLRLYILTSKT